MHRIYAFLIIFWWGILITIGFIVVPILFKTLPTPTLAGNTAAIFFKIVNWVSMAIGLIIFFAVPSVPAILRYALLGAVFCAVFSQFVATPHIIARDNLALWHSLSSVAYMAIVLVASLWLYYVLRAISD